MRRAVTTVAVTGANGFIGGRLVERLKAMPDMEVLPLVRTDGPGVLREALANADAVAHMAGVTRPREFTEFEQGNRLLTEGLADAVRAAGVHPLILFASTIRAAEDTEYGRTKKAAENALSRLGKEAGCAVAIFRLGQVFGRGARPYYNAITATLLADAAQGRVTRLERPGDPIELVDVADVVDAFAAVIARPITGTAVLTVERSYRTSVGAVAELAERFGRGEAPDTGQPMQVALFDAYRGYAEADLSAN